MYLKESFKVAWQSLLANKLRSFLTTLGVIIGIAAVITLVSIGEGAKSFVLNQIRGWGVGANSLVIHPGKAEIALPEITFTYGDVLALREIKNLVFVIPEVVGKARLKYGKKEYTPTYTLGISADYPLAFNHKTVEGRFYSKADENSRKPAAVIGLTVARKLFGAYSPLGEKIKINNISFQIIGVLEEKGAILTYDMDDLVLIPTTLSEKVLGTKQIWEIFITVKDEKQVPLAIAQMTKLLLSRHKKEDFHIHTQQGMLEIINNILNALTAIVSAIAAISLLVGGIGIMNIMLVTVTERTREIGIRKALGAKRQDIFFQFVCEAILITMTGAVFGVLVGTLAAWGIMTWLKLEAVIAWQAAGIACLVAFLVGTFFGVYPAMRAARLDPVVALRAEV